MTARGKKRTAALQLHFVQLDDGLQRRVVRDVGHDRLRMRAERLLESLYRVEKEMRLRNEARLRAGLHAGEALIDLRPLAGSTELLLHHRDVLRGVVRHIELLARSVLVEHAHLDHACPPQRFAATASLAPSVTKIAPVRRCSSETAPGFARSRRVVPLASSATATFTTVPWTSKSRPSSTICPTAGPAAGSTNCGRKARKKSATFGFSTFVSTACAKIVLSNACWSGAVAPVFRGRRSSCTPITSR